MTSRLNPYSAWLGIPAEDQPADYYQLLGIPQFVDDRELISQASSERIAKVSPHKGGQHGRTAQKLASELAKATSCLMNPYRKHLYDQFLRSPEAADQQRRAAWPPLDETTEFELQIAETTEFEADLSPPEQGTEANRSISAIPKTVPKPARTSKPKNQWLLILGVAGLVSTALLVVALGAWFSGDDVAQTRPKAAGQQLRPFPAETVDLPEVETGPATATSSAELARADDLLADISRPPAATSDAMPSPKERIEKPDVSAVASADTASEVVAPVPLGANALRFDGDDYIKMGSAGAVDFARPFTLELWVRLHPGNESHWLAGDLVFGGNHPEVSGKMAGWQLWMMNGDSGRHRLALATGNGFLAEFPALENVWRHVAVCRDEKEFVLFIDGRRAASRDAESLISTYAVSPMALHVGGHSRLHPNQPNGFRGDLRAVRLSSICRYSSNFTPAAEFSNDDATRILLDFVGRSAAQIQDLSDSKRHGTIAGAEWFVDDAKLVAASLPGSAMVRTTPTRIATTGEPVTAKELEVSKKVAPPSDDELNAARQSVREILGEEFAAAKKAGEHVALSDKLMGLARDTKDDPASRYVLLDEASQQAILGRDLQRAVAVVEELETHFEVDAWKLKAVTMERAADVARTAQERRELAGRSLELAKDLLQAGHFELADEVAQIAVTAATRVRDAELGRAARHSRDQVQYAKRRWKDAQKALKQLESDPANPELNLIYGRYLCFQQGDWKTGVTYLAKGGNEALRNAAKLDVEDPSAAARQVIVADAWYEAVQTVEKADRPSVQQRFLFWARKAEPGLTGLGKAHVTKRIGEVESQLPKIVSESSSRGDDGPPRAVQPPPQFRGLLGRIQADTGDVGVLWKYECGLVLSNSSVGDILRQVGRGPGRIRMEFVGMIYVARPTTVNVTHRGGTPDGGQLAVAVDGRKLGEVGGKQPTSDGYKLDLKPGEHAVQWVLTGADLGSCVLQFVDAETGNPVVAYHNQALLTARRSTPFRARVNVNMIQN